MTQSTLEGQSVSTGPDEVCRATIREFATAVGETSPLCHDLDAARRAGYADIVAPPTFAFVPASRALADITARLDAPLRNQVHGEQSVTVHRPIVAGDVLTTTATLERVRVGSGRMVVTVVGDLADESGTAVASVRSVVLVSGVDS